MCKKHKSNQKKGWAQYVRAWFPCTKTPDRDGHKKQEVTALLVFGNSTQDKPDLQIGPGENRRKGKEKWGGGKGLSGQWEVKESHVS